MTSTLINAGGYKLVATVTPLVRPTDHCRVLLQSTLASAKDPHDRITVADLILSNDAALRFASALVVEASV